MLRIVSYNILADSFVRRDRYPGARASDLDPGARRARLISRIEGFDADVLALQEVEPDMHDAIMDRLGSSYRGRHALREGAPDGCSIITRAEITHHEALHVDLGAGGKGRMSMIAILDRGGQRLGVVSAHLQWQKRSTSERDHKGLAQLLGIFDRIDALDTSIPWVVCGDFNADSRSPVLRAAYDRGWKLSCRSQRPWDTFVSGDRRRKIDYLLYRDDALDPRPLPLPSIGRDTPMPSPEHPSDHLPLVVDYRGL